MRITSLALLLLSLLAATPARAVLHITRDHGGYVEEYKAKYRRVRDRGERVIIDGICNSACTLVLGIVPMNRICVTPRASLGFHLAYYDRAYTLGIKVTSAEGTSDLLSYYPDTVKDWIRRNGGLTNEMKKIKNGEELWRIVDPCPDEWQGRAALCRVRSLAVLRAAKAKASGLFIRRRGCSPRLEETCLVPGPHFGCGTIRMYGFGAFQPCG